MAAEAEPGALVGEMLGKYELLALIAIGGTAEIYLARIGGEAGFEKYVVVKCLHDHLVHETEYVDMFLDEARLGAQLDHSNIVQTLELGEHRGRYYMVMEYLAGLSMAQIGRSAYDRLPGGLIPTDLVLGLAAQACAGLHYAHERSSDGKPLNIVHRDISPQNLVVSFDGVLKLVDFGIAKAERRRTQTESGTIKGKFAYMSPEQCKAERIDRRTDIFALATIVHELLTGRRLFKRESTYETYQAIVEGHVPAPSALNPNLDSSLDEVVLKGLAYDQNERYPTAEAFGEAMLGLVHKRGGSASASDVATFFDEYFALEIEEHAAQMREVIAGRRQRAMTGSWDIREGGSESDSAPASDAAPARPSSEFVDDLARDRRRSPPANQAAKRSEGRRAPSGPASPGPSLRELANQPTDDFEDNAETHIEPDPIGHFEDVGASASPQPARARRDSGATEQTESPAARRGGGGEGAPSPQSEKRTMLLGTPAPDAADESDLESRKTDEEPQVSSTLYRPDGAPPPSAPAAPAQRRSKSSAPREARPSSAAEGAQPTPPPIPPTQARADSAAPAPSAKPARPARQMTSPAAGEASPRPSPLAVALAFFVSAGVGFGATLLAGQFLG